jgi:hypothetical protein
MFEQICETIIRELGATGLLILGLYWVIGKYLKKMSGNVDTINHNTTEMVHIVKGFLEKVEK